MLPKRRLAPICETFSQLSQLDTTQVLICVVTTPHNIIRSAWVFSDDDWHMCKVLIKIIQSDLLMHSTSVSANSSPRNTNSNNKVRIQPGCSLQGADTRIHTFFSTLRGIFVESVHLLACFEEVGRNWRT